MPTEQESDARTPSHPETARTEESELRAAAREDEKRVRRLKINVAAWGVGAGLLTALRVHSSDR